MISQLVRWRGVISRPRRSSSCENQTQTYGRMVCNDADTYFGLVYQMDESISVSAWEAYLSFLNAIHVALRSSLVLIYGQRKSGTRREKPQHREAPSRVLVHSAAAKRNRTHNQ